MDRTEPQAWATENNGALSANVEVEATRKRPRLRGVDVARAVAVLGMVAVHFGPNPIPETFGGDVYGIFRGRASVLFVFLAGVGVALLARRGAGWRVRGKLLTRGALLLPLGMWLQGLDHNVLVILQYYAVYFLFAALVLSAPGWLLLLGIGLSLTLGPMLYLVGFDATPRLFAEGYAAFGEPVGAIFYDLLLSGAYPLATWAAPLLFGILLGRLDLTSGRIRIGMVLGGLAMAVGSALVSRTFAPKNVSLLFDSPRYPLDAGFGRLLSSEPHSQMPLWLLGATASAVAMLGLCLLLADALPRAIQPLAATGQMALTVYVGHIILLGTAPEIVERETVPAAVVSVGTFMVVVAVVCFLWRLLLPRGPLEAALAAPGLLIGLFDRDKEDSESTLKPR